jgi:polygalacturonase
MSRVFEIGAFGARPDGRTLCTAAIQQAIDACHAAGGGRVLCEAGTYLTGTLTLRSHVELANLPGAAR